MPIGKRLSLVVPLTLSIAALLSSCSQQSAPKKLESPATQAAKPMNIVMIAVDDLNHWVGHLKRNQQVQTPNIDSLAAKGVSFHRAYAPSAICNATRTAMMTGLRPNTSGVYSNGRDWRSVVGSGRSLPAFFKQNGYEVLGGGKIFHNDQVIRQEEWDYYYYQDKHSVKYELSNAEQAEVAQSGVTTDNPYKVGMLPINQLKGGDDVLNDYHVARWAADEAGKVHEKPFFLAVGIFRPHLPWGVPKKYFDMYPVDSLDLPPYKEDDLLDLPNGIQAAAEHELILKEGSWKKAIQAYLASITYADVQIGRVLEAIEKGPNKDNTMIVLWGDHGWHLGEKHRWRKFALWEEATRTPYIWYVPGLTPEGGHTDTPIDLQSLWPTLAQLSGLKAPDYVEGHSIATLLAQPNANWQIPAITTQGFNNHAIRWQDYRYISYSSGGEEFYNHDTDPYEWDNMAKAQQYQQAKQHMKISLPALNRDWSEAAKIYGGESAFNQFKEAHAVTTND